MKGASNKVVLGLKLQMTVRPFPVSLADEFIGRAPVVPHNKTMSLIEQRYILWCLTEGIAVNAIARLLDRSWKLPLFSFIDQARSDPTIFLECRYTIKVRLGKDKKTERWLCRYCHELDSNPTAAGNHAWAHAFSPKLEWMPAPKMPTIPMGVRVLTVRPDAAEVRGMLRG